MGKSYLTFFYFVGRQLAWAFTHVASDNDKLLAQEENLLVLMNGQHFFQALLMLQNVRLSIAMPCTLPPYK